jgi:TatD DNase family protein
LARKFPDTVVSFIGVHPSEAARTGNLDWLAEAAGRASGIGEIGLDPAYSEVSEKSEQTRLFVHQLELAEKLGKPVQVHCRGSARTCLDMLTSYRLRSVLLHWFEDEATANVAAQRKCYVSFGPALLYSKKLKRIATAYADSLILTESDGPVSFSALGKIGGSFLIPSVVFRLAEAKRKTYEELGGMLVENCQAFLGE